MTNKPTILIIGASRGLGLALVEEFCSRDWHVIATVRRKSPALDALKARFPGSLEEETTDIADEASVRALRQRLDGRTIGILFVNAGIAKSITATPGTAPVQDFLDMMLVNAFSPVRLIEIFEDIVAPNGTMAAMSSELGSITNNEGRWDLYASSKAALDMLMKCYTAHRPDDRRAKLIVAPGWIQTEMGSSDATFTIEECIPLVADILEKNHERQACAMSTGSTRRCLGTDLSINLSDVAERTSLRGDSCHCICRFLARSVGSLRRSHRPESGVKPTCRESLNRRDWPISFRTKPLSSTLILLARIEVRASGRRQEKSPSDLFAGKHL